MVDDDPDARAGYGPGDDDRNASFRTERDGRVVIHVGGELDARSGSHLSALLAEAFEGSPDAVIIDLTDLDFVDSVGLTMLVTAHHQGRSERIPFEVHNVSPQCMRLFEITQLVELLDLH